MLSFAINWIIIGVVVYILGRLISSKPKTHSQIVMFFVVVVFWPISVMAFLVTCAKLVSLLARKHGLR